MRTKPFVHLARALLALSALVLILGSVGCRASTPEGEWSSFISDVEAHRGDKAAKHVAFERWLPMNPEQDPAVGVKSGDWLELFKKLVIEEQFDKGRVPFRNSGLPASQMRTPSSVQTQGNTATLVITVGPDTAEVRMEKIRRKWMIVSIRAL